MGQKAVLADDRLHRLRFRNEPAGQIDEMDDARTGDIAAIERRDDGFGGGDATVGAGWRSVSLVLRCVEGNARFSDDLTGLAQSPASPLGSVRLRQPARLSHRRRGWRLGDGCRRRWEGGGRGHRSRRL